MGQFLGENIPYLVKDSATQLSLPATYLGQPTRIQVGGQGYKLNAALVCNLSSGGLDTGSLAANTLYYVYAVISGGNVVLEASLNGPGVGPTGFTQFRSLGAFRTLSGSAAVDYVVNSVLQDEDQWAPVPGSLSGSAVAAGYIGEDISGTLAADVSTASGSYGSLGAATSLSNITAGVWSIHVYGQLQATWTSGGTLWHALRIRNTTDSVDIASHLGRPIASGNYQTGFSMSGVIKVSGTKTIQIEYALGGSGNGTLLVMQNTRILAVRIA